MMVSTLEREIIEKFKQLDSEAQQRVREMIDPQKASSDQSEESGFDYEAWFRNVETLRQQIAADHEGKMPAIDIVGLLHETRE